MGGSVEESLEISVKPDAVERTLKKMRAEKEGAPAGTEPVSRPNIVLSNFVITLCAPLVKVRPQLETLLKELAPLIPSRVFIVSFADTELKELSTAVRLRDVKAANGESFYFEEIFIETSKSTLPLISSLLRSLFTSDVPIVSYVVGEPKQETVIEELLQKLQGMCDLFLFDSKEFVSFTNGVSALLSLRRIIRPHGQSETKKLAASSVRVRDLNWYRLEKLRSLLAGLYDASSFSKESIKTVEVLVNRDKPSPTSLVVAGWLEEALERKDLVKIIPTKLTAGQTSAFVKVVVKGKGFEISVSQDGEKFEVSSGGSTRVLNSKPLSEAQLISLPVQSSGMDDYFTKSFEHSLSIAQQWA